MKDMEFYIKVVEALLSENLKDFLSIILDVPGEFEDDKKLLNGLIEEIQRILFPTRSTCTICDVEIKVKRKKTEEEVQPGQNISLEKE